MSISSAAGAFYPPKLKLTVTLYLSSEFVCSWIMSSPNSSYRLRKRENPRPLDESAATTKFTKLSGPLRNAPSENDANCSALSTQCSGSSQSLGEPRAPLKGDSQSILNRGTRKQKGRKGKKKQQPLVLVSTPKMPVVKLSSEVIGSIHSVLGVEGGCEGAIQDSLVEVPVLHPHLSNQEVKAILRSRNNTGLIACPDLDDNKGCVFIGRLVCQLEGSLDMGGIFRDGCEGVQLALFLGKSSEGAAKWQLQVEVGEAVWCVPVKMDRLLTELSIGDTEKMFSDIAPLVKLFLPHDSHCGSIESLPLEFWATSKICNPVSASDRDCKLPTGKKRQEIASAVYQLVSMLYPGYCFEELLKDPIEGMQFEFHICRRLQIAKCKCRSPKNSIAFLFCILQVCNPL